MPVAWYLEHFPGCQEDAGSISLGERDLKPRSPTSRVTTLTTDLFKLKYKKALLLFFFFFYNLFPAMQVHSHIPAKPVCHLPCIYQRTHAHHDHHQG